MANKYLEKLAERTTADFAKHYGKRAVRKLSNHIESTIMGATLGATGGYIKGKAAEEKKKLEERRKARALKKAASLLKGKSILMKTSPKGFRAKGVLNRDVPHIERMIDRIEQVENLAKRSGKTQKVRMTFPGNDKVKGFIRSGPKGTRSRLYGGNK